MYIMSIAKMDRLETFCIFFRLRLQKKPKHTHVNRGQSILKRLFLHVKEPLIENEGAFLLF